eukprot:GHVH01010629.1.p1 GENE.GHVH01010629.1~~GHVH01010629.1.p1  ORF type:complete len:647 (-),score=78.99 GHVH01010629.1:100-2040(-)
MHSARVQCDIGERITENPPSYNKGPQGERNQTHVHSEPYASSSYGGSYGGYQTRGGGYRDGESSAKTDVPRFLSFRGFCASDDSKNVDCQTADQFNAAYKSYKDEYKREYVVKMTQLSGTFNDKVIRDRANTSCILSKWAHRKLIASKRSVHYLQCMEAGSFKDLRLIAPPGATSSDQDIRDGDPVSLSERCVTIKLDGFKNSGADVKLATDNKAPLVMEPPFFPLDADQCTIVLRELPDYISREIIDKYLREWNLTPGLAEFEIIYDNINKIMAYWDDLGENNDTTVVPKLMRSARIQFENQQFAEAAVQKMQGRPIIVDGNEDLSYTIHPVSLAAREDLRARVLGGAFAHPDVVALDIRLSSELVKLLDAKFGIVESDAEHPLLRSLADDSSYVDRCHQLDLQLSYLAYVHNIDYFGHRMEGSTCNLVSTPNYLTSEEPCQITLRPCIGELDNVVLTQLEEYKIQSHVRLRRHETAVMQLVQSINEPFPTAVDEEHPEVKHEWNEFINENIVNTENGRARCGVCEKLFRGPDFVTKHLQNKHIESINKVIERVDYKLMEARFLDDKLNLYLLPPPQVDNDGSKKSDRQLISREDAYKHAPGGPIRRSHPRWQSKTNTYRDWDAPAISVRKKATSFRKMTNYDDL